MISLSSIRETLSSASSSAYAAGASAVRWMGRTVCDLTQKGCDLSKTAFEILKPKAIAFGNWSYDKGATGVQIVKENPRTVAVLVAAVALGYVAGCYSSRKNAAPQQPAPQA